MPPSGPPSRFAEIHALLPHLPGPDLDAARAAAARDLRLTKPAGALGRLEEIVAWLATWQGRHPPTLRRPRVAVFAGNHGVAARGVSAYPAAVTAQMVANFVAGGAAVNQLCRVVDADLRVYELDLDHPTADFTRGPAMDEARAMRALAYGMMAVEPGLDLLALGEMGIANTTSAAALAALLMGGSAADWTGAGTGVVGEQLATKTAVVAEAIARHGHVAHDPLAVLAAVGGEELAAIAGAILAARLARLPVMLDGFACTAAAAVLWRLDPGLLDHCRASHRSAEQAHGKLLATLGLRPLLDLDLRLGEASGAALAIGLARAAVECHVGMATFDDAGVSGPV
jgi:nicotinate-nucleotide--dimethylbenzimidazole phosphoribosyltransferase